MDTVMQISDCLRSLRRELSVSIQESIKKKKRSAAEAPSANGQNSRSKNPQSPQAHLSTATTSSQPPSTIHYPPTRSQNTLAESHLQPNSLSISSPSPAKPTLLTLPREIRDQIWTHLLGDRVLHIGNPSTQRVTHIVCCAPISDALAQEVYPSYIAASSSLPLGNNSHDASPDATNENIFSPLKPSSSLYVRDKLESKALLLPPGQNTYDPLFHDRRLASHSFRHSSCFADSWKLSVLPTKAHPSPPEKYEVIERCQLNLSIMRTCKQIYEETFAVVWSGNTWGFAKSITFKRFVRERTAAQRELMRHLIIKPEDILREGEEGLHRFYGWAWRERVKAGVGAWSDWGAGLQMLGGLRSVCLLAGWRVGMETLRILWCEGEVRENEGAIWDVVDELREIEGSRQVRVCVQELEVILPWMGPLRTARCMQMEEAWRKLMERRIVRGKGDDGLGGEGGVVSEMDEEERRSRKVRFEMWKKEQRPSRSVGDPLHAVIQEAWD